MLPIHWCPAGRDWRTHSAPHRRWLRWSQWPWATPHAAHNRRSDVPGSWQKFLWYTRRPSSGCSRAYRIRDAGADSNCSPPCFWNEKRDAFQCPKLCPEGAMHIKKRPKVHKYLWTLCNTATLTTLAIDWYCIMTLYLTLGEIAIPIQNLFCLLV